MSVGRHQQANPGNSQVDLTGGVKAVAQAESVADLDRLGVNWTRVTARQIQIFNLCGSQVHRVCYRAVAQSDRERHAHEGKIQATDDPGP